MADDPHEGSFVHNFKRFLVALVPSTAFDFSLRLIAIGVNGQEKGDVIIVALELRCAANQVVVYGHPEDTVF